MDVESLAKQLILQNMTPEQQNAVLESVRASLQEARNNQKRRVSENVGMVVDALKKIEADIRAKYDDLGNQITTRVNSIKDGRDGIDGRDGKDGKDGRPGRDGATGPMGPAGRDGRDGVDGEDGVSVIDAKIDFDGSLVITLSNGREINVGEVVAADVAEKIRVLTYGGGSGGGTSGLNYKGTWNASTNTPTLTSSIGTNGDYYIVSVAGTTDLNGITDWQPGDWVIFNGAVWQKIDQSWATAGANSNITSMTGITGGISSPDFIQFDTGATVTNAAGRLYWDATQQTLTVGLNANIAADIGQTLYAYATNDESVTINKGQPVYMFAAQGDRVSVKLAYNTSDATSAKTLGVCAENIAAGQAGMILCQGVQDGLDMSAYSAGDTLYLGATAGTLTNVKPYAPNHLVYIGVVERANAGNGRLYVRVQNGYEMDELHNVSAQNPSNGQVLIYNASTSLWEKNTLTDGTGITITEGAGSITITNNGVRTAQAGDGISVSGTNDITITNTGVRTVQAGTGISVSGTNNVTVTNAGVTSLTGTANQVSVSSSTGSVTLSLPSSISVDLNGSVGATTPNTGAFTTLSVTGVTTVQAGTVSAPAITTSGDTNTGIFFPAADTIAFTEGGTESFRLNSSGQVAVNAAGSASTPTITKADDLNTGVFFPAADTVAIGTGGTEALRVNSSQNVGIGTNSPNTALTLGNNRVLSWPNAAGNFNGTTTGTQILKFSDNSFYIDNLDASTSIIFRRNNNVESMRIDSSGNMGIGTSSPGSKLDVSGTVTATSVNTQNTFGFKNRIINGAMAIWQRGTTTGSVAGTTAPYMVDRFYGFAATGNITISRSTDVPSGFPFSTSMVGTGVSITQRIESVNCIDLGGATVTVSFWAKSTAGSDNLTVSLYTATGGVDNYSSQTTTTNTVSASPSGSWTYYTTTFASIPSTATNGVGIGISRGSGGSSTTLITGVQLEKGSTATSFDYRPYTTELQLCQRYYFQYAPANTDFQEIASRNALTTATVSVQVPVTMRSAPTAVLGSSPYGRVVGYDSAFGATTANVTGFAVSVLSSNSTIQIGLTHASMTAAAGLYGFSFDTLGSAAGIGLRSEL